MMTDTDLLQYIANKVDGIEQVTGGHSVQLAQIDQRLSVVEKCPIARREAKKETWARAAVIAALLGVLVGAYGLFGDSRDAPAKPPAIEPVEGEKR